MNIIKYRFFFLGLSAFLIAASIVAVAIFGLRPGIDFVGGALWEIRVPNLGADGIRETLLATGSSEMTIFPGEQADQFLIRLPHISEEEHQQYVFALKTKSPDAEEIRYESIGPTIGGELKKKAYRAIVLVLLGISLYIAFAFRKVSRPISSWKYGIVTLLTLFHDIAVPTGLLAVLGKYVGVEVDTNFVVALLVVMGFSVHDTIVVFDRIRENLMMSRDRSALASLINESVRQTFARSLNTSLTLFLVLVALFFFGPVTLKYFVLTILVGTMVGTYSSIFVASPLLLYFQGRRG